MPEDLAVSYGRDNRGHLAYGTKLEATETQLEPIKTYNLLRVCSSFPHMVKAFEFQLARMVGNDYYKSVASTVFEAIYNFK